MSFEEKGRVVPGWSVSTNRNARLCGFGPMRWQDLPPVHSVVFIPQISVQCFTPRTARRTARRTAAGFSALSFHFSPVIRVFVSVG